MSEEQKLTDQLPSASTAPQVDVKMVEIKQESNTIETVDTKDKESDVEAKEDEEVPTEPKTEPGDGDEDEFEEEEEEEEEFAFEVKLDVETDPKKQNILTPISLQQNGGANAEQQNAEQSGGRHYIPAPSQSNNSIYDAEYSTDPDADRPWTKHGADITDYFNYGFTERTWELYHIEQKRKRMEFSMTERIGVYEASKDEKPMEFPSDREGSRSSPSNRTDSNWPPLERRRGRETDDMVHLGSSTNGNEYTITPTIDSRQEERRESSYSQSRDRDERDSRDSRDSRDMRDSRDTRRRDYDRDRRFEPRDDRRRDDRESPRYRDERSTGKRADYDYPKGPDSDRKRPRHY